MRFQFEVGARVVPREIPHTQQIGTVIDRMKKRGRPNCYLVELKTSAGNLYASVPEDTLVRKTDG